MANRRFNDNPELQALAGTEVIPAQAMSGGTDTASNPVAPGDDIKIKASTLAPWLAALPLNLAKGADIASAATTNIAAATGNYLHITGTTTITGLGTAPAGAPRVVVFDGALTLTHHATSLILPAGANIATAAGDCAVFVSEGSGNWRCMVYQRASGRALKRPNEFAQVMLSNMDTALTTGTGKAIWFAPEPGTLVDVWIAVGTVSSSGVVRIDMNDSGGSVFTTRPSIDAGEATSLTGTAAVLDGTVTFAKGDAFLFDIDDAGTGAKAPMATIEYEPTA